MPAPMTMYGTTVRDGMVKSLTTFKMSRWSWWDPSVMNVYSGSMPQPRSLKYFR